MATAVIPEFTVLDRMVKARQHAGLSQTELAEVLGVSLSTVRRLEDGSKIARAIELMGWASATGVSTSWLVSGLAVTDPVSETVTREYPDQLAFPLYAAA